jgi:hypothetical protein
MAWLWRGALADRQSYPDGGATRRHSDSQCDDGGQHTGACTHVNAHTAATGVHSHAYADEHPDAYSYAYANAHSNPNTDADPHTVPARRVFRHGCHGPRRDRIVTG